MSGRRTMVAVRWCRLGAFGLPFGCPGGNFASFPPEGRYSCREAVGPIHALGPLVGDRHEKSRCKR